MTLNSPEPLLIYVHINKNGGTSVRQLLQNNFGTTELFDTLIPQRWGRDGKPRSVHSDDEVVGGELAELVARQWRLRCFAANLPFGVHELLDRACVYTAVIRHPVDRVLSLWSHTYRDRLNSPQWRSWERLNLDIARILAHPFGTALHDDQIRMLTGVRRHHVDEALVQQAIENLDHSFVEVGRFEELHEFARRLSARYGFLDTRFEHLNAGDGAGRELLADDDIAMLREANRFDMMLYEAVGERFHASRP